MDGFLVVDKPKGITSFDVIRELRKKLHIKKMGHLGTLDPLATGVLVVAIGKGTKMVEFLMKADKEYEAEVLLGAVSNTYDAEGKIDLIKFDRRSKKITEHLLEPILDNYRGVIDQVPPKYSALKVDGERAYKIMRKGGDVKMKPRKCRIDELKLLEVNTSGDLPMLKLNVKCSSGTYIRSIAHDIGKDLEIGGLLSNLRRTKVGHFNIDQTVDLEDRFTEDYLNAKMLPLEFGFQRYAKVVLGTGGAQVVKRGGKIRNMNEYKPGFVVGAYFKGKIISIMQVQKDGKFLRVKKNL